MTGARRFSLSSPDWGQAHLTLDAIVAYVDDELSPVAHARAQAHLECCGECRAEVVAQRQARTALRGAGGPNLPSSLLHSLRSIPVEAELPPMPPGLGVTADGQFVLLRDVPQAPPDPTCPGPRRPCPPAAGRSGSRPGRGAAAVLPPGALRGRVGAGPGRAGRRRAGHAGRHAGARATGARGCRVEQSGVEQSGAEQSGVEQSGVDLPAGYRSVERRPRRPGARDGGGRDLDPAHRGAGGPRRAATRPPEPHPAQPSAPIFNLCACVRYGAVAFGGFPTSWRWRGVGCGSRVGVRGRVGGFRCAGREGGLRAEVAKPAADPGRGEPARWRGVSQGRRRSAASGRASRSWVYAAMISQVQRSAGGRVADLRGGPAEGLLEQPEGVFEIEAAQERLPAAVDIGGGGAGARPPQPHRFRVCWPGR